MQESNTQVSDNELDYIKFIIYYRKGVQESEKLLPYVADNHLEVRVVDVDTIPKRPDWLRGVPTIILNPRKNPEMLQGSYAVKFVMQWHDNNLKQMSHMEAQNIEIGCASTFKGPASGYYSKELFNSEEQDPNEAHDARYVDNPKSKLSPKSLEDYFRARGQTLDPGET